MASLVRTLREMKAEFGLDGGVAVSDRGMRFPGRWSGWRAARVCPKSPGLASSSLVAQALDELEEMRRAEGGRVADDLRAGLAAVEASAGRIEALAASARESQRASLLARVRELVAELGLDDARLYQEVVRAVERHDVTEELQRLRSHLDHGPGPLRRPRPRGKRLDFLAQELMREANTIGSKAADAPLVQEVVDLKAEIERVREQVQNVE